MYRWDFWLWNFQNGCCCHGNRRNVKLLTLLKMNWTVTERYIVMCWPAFTVKLFSNGCRLEAIGEGWHPLLLAMAILVMSPDRQCRVTYCYSSVSLLLLFLFFQWFLSGSFFGDNETWLLIIVNYNEEQKISGCSGSEDH